MKPLIHGSAKPILLALALLLASPLVAQGGDQVVPNGVLRIGATEALDASRVNVAVVDTGIDTTHPDLTVAGGVDCSPLPTYSLTPTRLFTTQDVRDASNPFAPQPTIANTPGYQDAAGHGTHVSGTIGALDNDLGVIGVAPGVNLYAVRVLDGMGGGTAESVTCGLEWIARHHARIGFDVVNMSLGMHFTGEVAPVFAPCHASFPGNPVFVDDPQLLMIQEAICDLTDLGIPVVVAAGNDAGSAAMNFPALLDNVITVSNFSDFDGQPGGLGENVACPEIGGLDDALWTHWNGTPERDYSSANGIDVDIAAPGTCILSTLPGMGLHGGGYATATGTSMAAPHVTGLIARYLARCPEARAEEVRAWLLASADPQRDDFYDTDEWPEPTAHDGVAECG
jgi:subtilisin